MRLVKMACILSTAILMGDGHQRPIVVIIPSYNNQAWCVKNLESVFMQHYDNYRVIYLDDCSTDQTYALVCDCITQCHQQDRVTLIRNEFRRGALANQYHAAWLCQDTDIIVHLDGDDRFAHPDVLQRINHAYARDNVWLTYGQYATYPPDYPSTKSKPLPVRIVQHTAYREYPWITSAPRTFYAWLFKEIRLESLLHKGKFFTVAGDVACMFPMLEMAAGRVCFIPDILYIYNCQTSLNDHKIHLQAQLQAEYTIRAQKKYKPYTQPAVHTLSPEARSTLNTTCACLIISDDTPEQLSLLLQSLQHYLHTAQQCTVLYCSSQHQEDAYLSLKKQWSRITFVRATADCYQKEILSVLATVLCPCILMMTDDVIFVDDVDAALCARFLHQTKAHAFYLTLGKDSRHPFLLTSESTLPPHTALGHGINVWQFSTGEYGWSSPHEHDALVVSTEYLKCWCQKGNVASKKEFLAFWRLVPSDSQQAVGLFFDCCKVRIQSS